MTLPFISVLIPTYGREQILCDTIADVLKQSPKEAEIIVGEQDGEPPSTVPIQKAVVVAVGPEGGFTDDELSQIRSDPRMRSMAIGHHRLRAETAAIALLSVVASRRS